MIITIDGPGGAGKSTVARRLARELGLRYLNSGFLYRAVTLLVLEAGGKFDDRTLVSEIIRNLSVRFEETAAGTRVWIDSRDVTARLKAPDVTPEVYRIANDGEYRALLVDQQRRFASAPGVVAEGRDMGTVIFPDADVKFYLDASADERARRTYADLQSAGHTESYETVLEELQVRDAHDRNREHAPLCTPAGGIRVVTDGLEIDAVVDLLRRHVSGELVEEG